MADNARVVAAEPAGGGLSPADGSGVTCGVTRASLLLRGERRLEAETYLSDGYGVRMAIESQGVGWSAISELASVWQPSRLKGITVDPEYGVPFLAAGQVFEVRPTARKWLSLARTEDAANRFVPQGTLLLSCSGTVGRIMLAHKPHDGALITHDLLRIEPKDEVFRGWLYAYMRTATFRAMATGSHYGHVIKHLEPAHVASLPVVAVPDDLLETFNDECRSIFASRDEAYELILEAEALYAAALGEVKAGDDPSGFAVPARSLLSGRRRLDAYHYSPQMQQLQAAFERAADRIDSLEGVTEGIWWPGRFRRVFGDNGTPYLSAVELFDVNPPITKRIYAGLVENSDDYFLSEGWLVMARSGQIYGLNGSVFLASHRHTRSFISEDLIRIVPDRNRIRPGYLWMVLSHPSLGRPLVLSHAYGTSIPHLEPGDLRGLSVPRLQAGTEAAIADRMEEASRLRSDADDREDEMTASADKVIAGYLHGARSQPE